MIIVIAAPVQAGNRKDIPWWPDIPDQSDTMTIKAGGASFARESLSFCDAHDCDVIRCRKNPNPVASAYKPSSGDNDILGLSGKRYRARHREITIFGPLARHQSLVMRSQDNCHMTMLMEEIR
jgi:hypothetical protein